FVVAGTPKEAIQLKAAASEFLDSKNEHASSTRHNYTRAISEFLEYLEKAHGVTLLKDVQTTHVKAYFNDRTKWRRNTKASVLTYLRVFFNWCREEERRWIDYSPVASKDLARGRSKIERKRTPFTPEEITKILAAIELLSEEDRNRARAAILLMLYTGMRISDLTFVEREYLTDDNLLDYHVIKTRRPISLAPELHQCVLDALAKLPPSRVYYFQPDRDDDYEEARAALKDGLEFQPLMPDYRKRVYLLTELVLKVVRLAGLRGTCHKFRDTFAMNMLLGDGTIGEDGLPARGADLYTVSRLLGHSSVEITAKHYLKDVKEYSKRMSQKTRVLVYRFPLTLVG
ncbi:MAG: site-specific integrase, partial [Acidobacteria bacterium Pan2503]|nr:site-specific integrase [Candidatus Acidoferrum panamensis]